MVKVYLYVDGECNYSMAEKCAKKTFGDEIDLGRITDNGSVGLPGIKQQVWHHAGAKFFWDWHFPCRLGHDPSLISRSVYFTAFTGSQDDLPKAKEFIRAAGFEPHVVLEGKDNKQERENRLKNDHLIVKAKGVDVALAVRMLEDAYHGNYDTCLLATSDADVLPVIDVVRRMGRKVEVIGFKEGMARDSPFLYVPDQFVNIGIESSYMKQRYKENETPAPAET
jgi:uncharacterized LabA/DUF88 family protein